MTKKNPKDFIKTVKYIYDHIDEPLTLTNIGRAIGLSVSSLKRLFADSLNQTPGYFIRRLRMEFAFQSLQRQNESILEIALRSGFEDQSAFARTFKETFGYPPREARNKLNIINELECVTLAEPDIVELHDFTIQSVTEQGLYFEAAPRAFAQLQSKLQGPEITDDFTGIFIGIGHDNPHEDNVKEDRVRFTAGVTLLDRKLGINELLISGGKYARFNYKGKPNNLGLAYHYIYGTWSVNSKFVIDSSKLTFMEFAELPNPSMEQNILIHVPLLN